MNTEELMIQLHSVRDVEDFVALSTQKPYRIFLDDGKHRVNGKSFMEMFCLSIANPLRVIAECSDEEYEKLGQEMARFKM